MNARSLLAVLAVIVTGLCGVACGAKTSKVTPVSSSVEPTPVEAKPVEPTVAPAPTTAESADQDAPATTVNEYTFEPSATLPEVPGTSDYAKLDKNRVVKLAVNTWAGWAPIIWANGGAEPTKVWKDAKGREFKVQLELIDNSVTLGDAFASGKVHIGWATVDMLPLVIERLKRDPRTMPRVYQQIDWSNGGDGIVVRNGIKDVSGLRGKTVVLAQNSPSHFFLLSTLLDAGVPPSEVKMKFTQDAFQAAAAFSKNKDIAGVVSWAPDIYNLTKAGTGNKLLVSTAIANKLIADVWFARADFARDNPDIIEGLVRGILDATDELANDDAKKANVGKMMDGIYRLPAGTGQAMLADAHWTNYAENREFMLVKSNPSNFQSTYEDAARLYKAIGTIKAITPFDKIMDFSVIKKLGRDPKYAASTSDYEYKFVPAVAGDINVESAILTKTVVINFFPNSYDPYKKVPAKTGSVLYDGNVDYTLEQIAKLAARFGAARIVLEGHTDASMRGHADEALVTELSSRRANAVKEVLVNKYKLPPNQFTAMGYGWSQAVDPNDPDNHAKNRRIEVRVIPVEAR